MKRYCTGIIVLLISACTHQKDQRETASADLVSPVPAGLVAEGKVLYASCAACHGMNAEGNETMNSPALANGDDWYLYRQLMNFKKGWRGTAPRDTFGLQMSTMAKMLVDSTAVSHVVAYIKTLPPVSLPALIPGEIEKGKRTYESVCGSCHGPAARGNVKMNAPRLNGIDDWYIKRQIMNFKDSARGAHIKDVLGAQMIPMMALLSNDQAVNDVIAYIRSTAQPPSE